MEGSRSTPASIPPLTRPLNGKSSSSPPSSIGRPDQHRFRRSLDTFSRPVVFFQVVLAPPTSTSKSVRIFHLLFHSGNLSIIESLNGLALSVTGPYESTAIVTVPFPINPRPPGRKQTPTVQASKRRVQVCSSQCRTLPGSRPRQMWIWATICSVDFRFVVLGRRRDRRGRVLAVRSGFW